MSVGVFVGFSSVALKELWARASTALAGALEAHDVDLSENYFTHI